MAASLAPSPIRTCGLIVACLWITAGAALAHPHAWIDVHSTVVLNERGQVVALEQRWDFDFLYSAFALDEAGPSAESRREAAMAVATTNLANLRDYDYFTTVRADGAPVALGTVRDYEGDVTDGRLWLRFVLPLEQPIDPQRKLLTYAIYDPSYYIEMKHAPDSPVLFRGGGTLACQAHLQEPTPTTDQVSLATALDRTAVVSFNLGAIFAEEVAVRCH